jgi:ABC-type spermidine/putrescine transport system permease subunit II
VRRRRIFTAKRGFTVWALLVYAFLYLPILVVVIFAFDAPSATSVASYKGSNICNIDVADIGNISVWNGFESCWFAKGLDTSLYVTAIKNSFTIALEASVIATILGLGAALALARMRRRWRAPFDVIVYLTLVVPEIVIAVASLIFFVQVKNNFGLFPGLGKSTILLGQIVFNASLAMLIIRARFVGMGDKLEEAAYDLGSGPFSTFRQVTLPRLMPAVIAAALLSFTFSFDDFVLPNFTNGTTSTWPIVLYSAVRFGITPAVNALATLMLLVTLVLIVAVAILLRRTRVEGPGQEEQGGLGAALGLG